jgi:hypothetical protein
MRYHLRSSLNAPSTSGPLSVTTCLTAPYRQNICSQKKDARDEALLALRALPSAAKERSSLAATMNLYPPPVGIFITSTYILENMVAGVETVMGICTLRVLRI